MPQTCPTDDALGRYAAGALDDAHAEAVTAHLGRCPGCLDRLDALARPPARPPRPEPPAGTPAALAEAVGRVLGAPPAPRDAPPDIPGYQVLERVGHGGMGTVYKAVHVRLGKVVAVKVMRGARSAAAAARFEREMRAVGRLNHPNIVGASDAGEADGVPFLVMEFVPGPTLAQLVRAAGPLDARRACKAVAQLAAGLAAAHAAGVVHRDVKPSNAVLTPDGTAKLLDLGLAALPEGEPEHPDGATAELTAVAGLSLTETGRALGTRDYMAPEQATDPGAADARADVFGLGATLWFLLTGTPPPRHGLPVGPLPGDLRRDLWERLLAVDPAARFPSAEAVRASLAGAGRRARGPGLLAGAVLLAALVPAGAGLYLAVRAPAPPKSGPPEACAPPPPAGRLPFDEAEAERLQGVWAEHAGVPVRTSNTLGMSFVLIPPGELGLTDECRVRITKPYYLATTETTAALFRQFVAATGHRTAAELDPRGGYYLDFDAPPGRKFQRGRQFHWRAPGHPVATDAHPVVHLSGADADAFCEWLSRTDGRTYRLPTEAEWLWAARCGHEGEVGEVVLKARPFDDPWQVDEWTRKTVGAPLGPRPVGGRKPNVWGLHDMLGNVLEICQDEYDALPAGTWTDYVKRGTHHQFRVVRGNAYHALKVQIRESRGRLQEHNYDIGFRVLLAVGP